MMKTLLETITKCKDVPYVRALKLARIFSCVLLTLAWLCAHVTNLYTIFLPTDTLHLLHQLVPPVSCRAVLHGSMDKMVLLFVILSLGPPKLKQEGAWGILQTVYDIGELLVTVYFFFYAINSSLELLSGLGSPDTRELVISLLYLFICIVKLRYNANQRLLVNITNQYPLRRCTDCVDMNGKVIHENDKLRIESKLYEVVWFAKDRRFYICSDKAKIIAGTSQDVRPLDDVVGKVPIEISDK